MVINDPSDLQETRLSMYNVHGYSVRLLRRNSLSVVCTRYTYLVSILLTDNADSAL